MQDNDGSAVMRHEDYMDFTKQITDATAYAIREQTICAMLEVLSEERELYNDLEHFERAVRKMVPLELDHKSHA